MTIRSETITSSANRLITHHLHLQFCLGLDIGWAVGRPTGLDFQRQKRRKAARCQPIKVAGLTITKALRQWKKWPGNLKKSNPRWFAVYGEGNTYAEVYHLGRETVNGVNPSTAWT